MSRIVGASADCSLAELSQVANYHLVCFLSGFSLAPPNHVTPEADRRPMTATETERNRDDDYVGPESGFMSNHSADSQC